MRSVGIGAAVFALMLGWGPGAAQAAGCTLKTIAEFHVVIENGRPLIDGQLNGKPARFILDTGSYITALWRSTAEAVKADTAGAGVKSYGLGGEADTGVAFVKELRLGAIGASNIYPAVLEDIGDGDSTSGLIGEDMLDTYDLELDLAHNTVRLIEPQGCQGAQVVYWQGVYSVADLSDAETSTELHVKLNGANVIALMDSGSSNSWASDDFAHRAGIDVSNTKAIGFMGGIGKGLVSTASARFAEFVIGEEKISNVTLGVANLSRNNKTEVTGSRVLVNDGALPDMILGLDFLKAHHIYIARKQGKAYFSYVGGRVFSDPGAGVQAKTP